MAKVLKFDRKEFGSGGVVERTRGDDWDIKASLVEVIGSHEEKVDFSADLGATGVTAYFPASPEEAATGLQKIPATVLQTACPGEFTMSIAQTDTPKVASCESGFDVYIEVEDDQGETKTYYSENNQMSVRDQGFQSF